MSAPVVMGQVAAAFVELDAGGTRSDQAAGCARILADHGQARVFLSWHLERCRVEIVEVASQCFWRPLEALAYCSDDDLVCGAFSVAVHESSRKLLALRQATGQYRDLLSDAGAVDCGPDAAEFQQMAQATFFSSNPDWFAPWVVRVFSLQFRLWDGSRGGGPVSPHLHQFLSQTCPELRALGWLPVLEFWYTSALLDQIQEDVRQVCCHRYGSAALPSLIEWFETSVRSWIASLFAPDDYAPYLARLKYFLYESVGAIRIEQMFDVIVDFPDSMGAITDLAECLARTDQQPLLIKSLIGSFEKRLLHAGAMTCDIVIQYIACFRVMRILDPSGLLVHNVIDPICAYLRTRADAVKVVVNALIDDSEPYGLLSELERPMAPNEPLLYADLDPGGNDDDEVEGEDWRPEPKVACGGRIEAARSCWSWWLRRSGNVLTQLVHIFGSTDQLMDEYRHVLAARLMRCTDFNTDKEVHHLELLKQRFGDAKFRQADVMVADIAMSKRIDANVRKIIGDGDFPLSCTIISKELWPPFNDADGDVAVVLPDAIRSFMDQYNRHYEVLKAPRELNFKTNVGCADLTLTFDDGRRVSLTDVLPLHAAVLFTFADLGPNRQLSLEEISAQTQIPVSLVQRKLEFWISKGVLFVTDTGRYSVVEFASQHTSAPSNLACYNDSDDDGERAFSAETQQRESAKLLESYILGILPSSFGGFTLQRIDAILRSAFASGSTYYCRSEGELHDFLEQLVREGKLECVDGVYKQTSRSIGQP